MKQGMWCGSGISWTICKSYAICCKVQTDNHASTSSSSLCGLSCHGHCHSYEHALCLSILHSMIGGCQIDEWCHRCGVVGLIGSFSPLARNHTGPKGSTVVHGWIGMSSVAKELQTSGTDDVCERLLVSASAYLLVKNVGPPKLYYMTRHNWSNASRFLSSCRAGNHISAPNRMTVALWGGRCKNARYHADWTHVMDINTNICKALDNFNIVNSDGQEGAWEEGGVGSLKLGRHSVNLETKIFGFVIHYLESQH